MVLLLGWLLPAPGLASGPDESEFLYQPEQNRAVKILFYDSPQAALPGKGQSVFNGLKNDLLSEGFVRSEAAPNATVLAVEIRNEPAGLFMKLNGQTKEPLFLSLRGVAEKSSLTIINERALTPFGRALAEKLKNF